VSGIWNLQSSTYSAPVWVDYWVTQLLFVRTGLGGVGFLFPFLFAHLKKTSNLGDFFCRVFVLYAVRRPACVRAGGWGSWRGESLHPALEIEIERSIWVEREVEAWMEGILLNKQNTHAHAHTPTLSHSPYQPSIEH